MSKNTTTASGRSGNSLATLSPFSGEGLFALGAVMAETKVNPGLVTQLVQAIAGIAWGSGHGEVQITIMNRKVELIRTHQSQKISDSDVLKLTKS